MRAGCFAGVWGHYIANRKVLKTEDIQQAMTAAGPIDDDHPQQNAQDYVVLNSFTHGSSADRMVWLRRDLGSGDVGRYDTFVVN